MSTPTTTAPVDVNAGFDAERAQQQSQVDAYNAEAAAYNALPLAERQAAADASRLAAFEARVAKGELVKIGENRYQATTGYDRGETFILQRSAVGDRQLLVMPEHGLDLMEGGRARLYTSRPAWHGLGQLIPGGTTSVQDVITLGGLDVPAVSIPVPDYRIPGLKGQTFKAPGKFILANGLTGEFWNVVGKVHKNIDPETSFAFMQNLVDSGEVTWESAGLMGGGRRVFISCKLPQGVTVDADGVADYVELFLVTQDARDGSASYKAMITPWVPRCSNTNRFALRDALAVINLRHTTGLPGRIEQARTTLGLTLKYAEDFAAEETALARTKVSMAKVDELLAEFFTEEGKGVAVFGGRNKAAESTRTAKANDRREDDLKARIATNRAALGDTLYMVEQVTTEHLDWGKIRTGNTAADRWNARIEASLAGQDDARKSQAHGRLMELVTR